MIDGRVFLSSTTVVGKKTDSLFTAIYNLTREMTVDKPIATVTYHGK